MAESVNEHEAAFIRAFVRREQRERCLTQIASSSRRGRQRFLDRLNHRFADDLDPRFVRDSRQVDNRIRKKPSLPCHVIADEKQYDGRDVAVTEAFEILGLACFGIIVSFIPGKLACYKGESPSDIIWLVHEDQL